MKAKILRHKSHDGRHGLITGGVLYESGSHIVPQLFPAIASIDWLLGSIREKDRESTKQVLQDNYELVGVIIRYMK